MVLSRGPDWVAPRRTEEWRDDDILIATAWLKSLVPAQVWATRIERTREQFLRAVEALHRGEPAALYDPADLIAWQIFQAETYAIDRSYWVPGVTAQIGPIMTRLGQELATLLTVKGVEARAERLMTAERRQSDAGLFELLVALAYRRNGWTDVLFVEEQRGGPRSHDITVSRPRRRWAVECKRMSAAPYAQAEKARGEALSQAVHALCRDRGRSVIVEAAFKSELSAVPDDYLTGRAATFLANPEASFWHDEHGFGRVREVDWRLAHRVLEADYVYYGASRMIELLVGHYDHDLEHSMASRWRPAPGRPLYADAVYQASVVSWASRSPKAVRIKARHFRQIVAGANGQMPSTMPGVIHVGVESTGDPAVDARRHLGNMLEMRGFAPGTSRLRWVYGNFFAPESTTQHDESWAFDETTAWYRIGNHTAAQPLPHHLLVSPEAAIRPGSHWTSAGISL